MRKEVKEMNKLLLMPAVVLLFALSSGCATQQYVSTEIGKLNERISKLEAKSTATAEEAVKKTTEAAERAATAEKKAEEAAAQAAAAEKKAGEAAEKAAAAEKRAVTAAEKATKAFELMQKK